MLACASCVIVGIWFESQVPEALFKAAGSFFIVGLANFLLWSPLVAYRFLGKLT